MLVRIAAQVFCVQCVTANLQYAISEAGNVAVGQKRIQKFAVASEILVVLCTSSPALNCMEGGELPESFLWAAISNDLLQETYAELDVCRGRSSCLPSRRGAAHVDLHLLMCCKPPRGYKPFHEHPRKVSSSCSRGRLDTAAQVMNIRETISVCNTCNMYSMTASLMYKCASLEPLPCPFGSMQLHSSSKRLPMFLLPRDLLGSQQLSLC